LHAAQRPVAGWAAPRARSRPPLLPQPLHDADEVAQHHLALEGLVGGLPQPAADDAAERARDLRQQVQRTSAPIVGQVASRADGPTKTAYQP